ncbi:hypothetical protein BASA50_004537 [Batrachochytrium salamandrivorans]|uniref:Uncharacterized protein n=1 Tax=Batrachochytrium salamandrivorans TaxID=1357716 RepID=A0ABQ8FFB5_9FUNG|nr:hypothetical protein BASA50_004537 [Batrachochytrium salamandrivorans]
MKAAAFATLTLLASAVCAAPPKKEYPKGPYETLRSSRNGGSFRQPGNSRSTLTQTWTPATAGGATAALPAAAATTASTAAATAQQQQQQQQQAKKKEGPFKAKQRYPIPEFVPPSERTQKSSQTNPESQNTVKVIPPPSPPQEEAGGYYNRDFSNWDTSSGEHESPDGYDTGSSTKLSLNAMMKSMPQIWKGAGEEYVTGALSTCDRIIEWIVDASGLSLAELKAEYVPGEGDSETENANKLLFDYVKRKIGLVETRKELILKSARVNKGN